jgi:hypothetical protein
MSGLVVLLMLFSAYTKLMPPKEVLEGFTKMGYAESLIFPIGVAELVCTILYVIPPTSVLGAILLTGYLGGAVEASVRAQQPWFLPAIVAVLVWGGLFLRDRRIRDLIPFKR